ADTEQRVAERARRTGQEMAVHAREIEQALAGADERFASSAAAAAARVEEQVSGVENRLAFTAETMGQKLNEQVSNAEAQLVSRANVIAETFTAVGQHIGQSTNDAAKTIGANTRELNTMLAARSAEMSKILDETARPLVERFAQGGSDLQKSMEEVTERATEKLRSENAALVDALASRTAETLSAVEGARSSLSDSVADLIGRMTKSSSQLGQLIDQAAVNLGQVDERLSGSTQSFAATTEKAAQTFASSARLVDSNTTRLTELSSSTLREVASIATKFDEHSRLLSSASDLLSSAQSNLEHTLERQSSLEDLAVGLVKKSEDLERVMRSFENLVGQTLQNAEGKTMESADKIRNAITDVVDSATKRFADATEEMRRTAGSIKSELDLTRAELKKGVIEMPEEAKESTSAIRRAVSEQINALKELSDIVAKSGRGGDGSEPRNLRPAPQAPAARAAEPPRRAPAPQPDLRTPQAPLGGPALRGTLDLERPAEAAPRPRGDASARTPQGGWVRDLLTAASNDEDLRSAAPTAPVEAQRATPAQRSPLHVVESLNSLSVDIARAIDHEASIELWNRYRRGERDVFTRRLYTLKGQQTFDEIRRKYQAEAEFRAAVDRYCDDFEKLLKDVSRNDRDNIMAQTYLTSDTGKVYTMLAHASGRLH
ncbi:kinesin, partial [Mesorhizobium sp. M7A.F.Ca.CA.001.12.1.1]